MSVNTVMVYFAASLGANTSILAFRNGIDHARADAAAAGLGNIVVGIDVDHVAEDGVAAIARHVADIRIVRDFVDAVDGDMRTSFELDAADLLDDFLARIGFGCSGRLRSRAGLRLRRPRMPRAATSDNAVRENVLNLMGTTRRAG
jgi:hypothetical protein